MRPDIPEKVKMNRVTRIHGSLTRKILTVDGNVHDVGASSSRGKHACSGDTSGIVRVDVDGQVGVLLPDSSNESAIHKSTVSIPDPN